MCPSGSLLGFDQAHCEAGETEWKMFIIILTILYNCDSWFSPQIRLCMPIVEVSRKQQSLSHRQLRHYTLAPTQYTNLIMIGGT